jgi:hypothetical protein
VLDHDGATDSLAIGNGRRKRTGRPAQAVTGMQVQATAAAAAFVQQDGDSHSHGWPRRSAGPWSGDSLAPARPAGAEANQALRSVAGPVDSEVARGMVAILAARPGPERTRMPCCRCPP